MKSKVKSNTEIPIFKRCIKERIYGSCIKRPMDIMLSFMAIVFLSPLLLIVAIFVRKKLGSPILFNQERPGIDEKMFTMHKFRTMTNEKDENGMLLPDEIRLTKFGQFLRSTSMDELPQLFNILKGEMSIVGPRPHIVEDVIFMNTRQRRRHSILPGLTGAAQVSGRNCIDWQDKLELDLEYIDNISFINDWTIILLTVAKVIKRSSIAPDGMLTGESLGDYLVRHGKITEEEKNDAIDNMMEIMNGYSKQNNTLT